jgi:hypothetical protein
MLVIKRRNNLLIDIFGKFLGFDFGVFTLNHGTHSLFVPTKIVATSVWTKVLDIGTDGCGQFPINEIGYHIHNGGITFKIDIKTDKAVIEWFAVS